jgi:hypothetical protein
MGCIEASNTLGENKMKKDRAMLGGKATHVCALCRKPIDWSWKDGEAPDVSVQMVKGRRTKYAHTACVRREAAVSQLATRLIDDVVKKKVAEGKLIDLGNGDYRFVDDGKPAKENQ